MAATIKHGDGDQAKSVEKVSHPSAKPFLHANSRLIGASTLNRRCFEVNIFAEIRLENTTLREALERYATEVAPKTRGLHGAVANTLFTISVVR